MSKGVKIILVLIIALGAYWLYNNPGILMGQQGSRGYRVASSANTSPSYGGNSGSGNQSPTTGITDFDKNGNYDPSLFSQGGRVRDSRVSETPRSEIKLNDFFSRSNNNENELVESYSGGQTGQSKILREIFNRDTGDFDRQVVDYTPGENSIDLSGLPDGNYFVTSEVRDKNEKNGYFPTATMAVTKENGKIKIKPKYFDSDGDGYEYYNGDVNE